MKKGKIGVSIVAVFIVIAMIAAILFSLYLSITENRTTGLVNENANANVSVKLKEFDIQINELMKFNKEDNKEKEFEVDGKQIVQEAAKILGTGYGMGKDAQYYGKAGAPGGKPMEPGTFKQIDCSGLVCWTLTRLGYEIKGSTKLGFEGFYTNAKVPVDGIHWVSTASGNSNYKLFKEVGIFNEICEKNTSTIKEIKFSSSNTNGASAYEVYENVKCNKSNLKEGRINVLKVNDPIAGDYRYYDYFDKNGKKQKLPMGTIVYSYSGGEIDHSWIYIGDLGTSNSEKAAEILVGMGIINDNQKQYVEESASTSHHWRIESHGGVGVGITNTDPNMGASEGRKKTGTIWAFQVANDEVEPGSYSMQVVKKDKNSTQGVNNYNDAIEGAEFEIVQYLNSNGDTTGNAVTAKPKSENGRATDVVFNGDKEIKITSNSTDRYQLREIKAPGGYNIVNNWTLGLQVKKENYKVSSVRLWGRDLPIENDGRAKDIKKGDIIKINAQGAITEQNDYVLALTLTNEDNPVIKLLWKDPPKKGKYELNVKKIDKDTKQPISGLMFTSQLDDEDKKRLPTGADGKVKLAEKEITKDNYNNVDHYTIAEEESKMYATLKGNLNLYVHKKEGNNDFYVDGISDTNGNFRKSITYSAKDTNEKDITCTATLDGGNITLEIENTSNKPPKLVLKKVDAEDNNKFLLDTKMTIKRKIYNRERKEDVTQIETLVDNKKLSEIGEKYKEGNSIVYTENDYRADPEEYVYEIYEDEAADGYRNILKGKMYIEVRVRCTPGYTPEINAVTTVMALPGQNVENQEIAEVQKHLVPIVYNLDRTIELTVENPQEEIPFSLELYKHDLNSEKPVSNINFDVTKEGESLGGFTTKNKAIELDKVSDAVRGKTYTYVITENNNNTKIVNKIAKTEVNVTVGNDGVVSGRITRVLKKGETEWTDYQTELENQVKLEGPDANNKFTVKIANSMVYVVKIIKKDKETQELLPGAKFSIKETLPVEKPILSNEDLIDYTFLEEKAISNSEYVYEITETEVPENYSEILKDIKIMLHIKTNELGEIAGGNTETYIDFVRNDTILDDEEKEILSKYVKLVVDTESNIITLNISNEKILENYNIQIVKVNKKGEKLKGAAFGIRYPDSTTKTIEDADSDDSKTLSYAEADKNCDGVISLYKNSRPFEINKTDLYEIVEAKAPDGGVLIQNTKVLVRVEFKDISEEINIPENSHNLVAELQGFTDGEGQTKAKAIVTLTVDATGAGGLSEIAGLKCLVFGNTIQIIFPNEMPEYKFSIYKENLEEESVKDIEFYAEKGNKIKLNWEKTDENGLVGFTEVAEANTTYTYTIKERSSVHGYYNILSGMDLKVNVVTDSNGRVKEAHQGDAMYTNYQLTDINLNDGITTEYVSSLISLDVQTVKINDEGIEVDDGTEGAKEIRKVILKIKNPYEYRVRLQKEDKYGKVINDKVKLSASKNGRTYAINVDNDMTTENIVIEPEEIQEWIIKELDVEKPYANILENKYIKLITTWDSVNKKIKAESLTIFNNDDTEIANNDQIYQYVTIGEVEEDILPIIIKNPTIYRLKLTKYETDGITKLKGATIFVNGEEVIGPNGELSYYEIENIDTTGNNINFIIRESKAAPNHINIFEEDNKYLSIVAKIDENNKVQTASTVLEHYKGNPKPWVVHSNEEIYKHIRVYGSVDLDGVPVINVDILNPVEYIFEVDKTDTAKNPLSNTYFEITSPVVKAQTGEFIQYSNKVGIDRLENTGVMKGTTNAEGKISYEEKCVEIGKEYEYKIVEKGLWKDAITPIPDIYGIYVKVKVNEDGSITLGTYENGNNFIVKDANENIVTKYDGLIEVLVDQTGAKPIVKVNIQNPVKYNLLLNKKIFGYEEENLAGRTFKVKNITTGREETLTTNQKGYFMFKENEMKAGTYKYIITEENDGEDDSIINILDGKAMVLTLNVAGDGKITVVKDNESDTTKGLYVYNYSNKTLGEKIPLTDKIYESVNITDPYWGVSAYPYALEGVQTVDLTVINPEQYEIMLYKKDRNTNETMNNVKFNVSVYDENENEVKIKDSRTFEEKDLSEVITAKVDGYDGVIKIDNILFEKTGLYTIKLEETPVDGYKKIGDIKLQILIIMMNGKYRIDKINIVSGEYFVDKNNIKITKDKEKQTVFALINNEQITGKYPLTIKKTDAKNNLLDGAKVKITALKDGREIEIYEDDGNVDSKNVLIPGEFKINDGFITIPNIRIEEAGSYILRIEETEEPEKYIGLETPVDIQINTSLVGTGKNQMYNFDSAEIIAGNENGLVSIEEEPGVWYISIKNEQFDLSLRKYITAIEHEGVNNEITNRVPQPDVTPLKEGKDTTAIYNHTKEPIGLFVNDIVTYTITIYNEADISGYAEVITDHLPEYLEFVDNEFNKSYGWELDKSDKTGKTVRTNYLSRAKNEKDNLINAYDGTSDKLDNKSIKIQCKVKEGTPVETKVTNIAEITDYIGEGGRKVIDRDSQGGNAKIPTGKELEDYRKSEIESGIKYIPGQQDDDDFEKVFVKEFDLALRKFITGVTNGRGEKTEVKTRIPVFKVDEEGNYIYEHTKEPVLVAHQNVVEYTIRVYNEGTIDGYAKEVKDDIPEGLIFLPDDSLNKEYRWIMLDKKGKETDDVNKAKYIVTDYLSKENEKEDGEYLLKAFDKEAYEAGAIKEPDYKEVKVAFKVTMPNTSEEIIVNKAQISDDSDSDGNEVTDKDSTPNKWVEGEDDQDIEKIRVLCFDLSLRKWVTKAIVTENGKTVIHQTGHKAEDDPEAVVKVDLKKSKIKNVEVKFEYQIRVTNDREIDGYVQEITDYIPEGLKFVPEDNPDWKDAGDGKVTTDKLKDTLLKHGETAEVTIILTWINGESNMGLKVNVAEISKDYNEYGSPDIDSTPNNQVPGEDDIDDAPVMLTVTTGQTTLYVGLASMFLGIVLSGVILIKKYVFGDTFQKQDN